jgi:hypothetical protein
MDGDTLYVNVGTNGSFSFTIDTDTQKLCLFSPESGVHKYIWDTPNERLVSTSYIVNRFRMPHLTAATYPPIHPKMPSRGVSK